MTSPFPGMDPYLEMHWGDVHARLIVYASDFLNARLPGDLRARAEERVYLEMPDVRVGHRQPDVSVVEEGWRDSGALEATAVLELADPLVYHLANDPITEVYLHIIDSKAGGRVVTGIEIVSPSNKLPGKGRDEYMKKQQEYWDANVHSVEIDLVREGGRVARMTDANLPPAARTAYQASVTRMSAYPRYEVYPIGLRHRLPAIRIPLRPGDADVALDIQAIVDQAYRNARYDATDYSGECIPPLKGEDAVWADALLREKGLR
jgi:Protein of unknown function (DUF4058)